MKQNMIMKLSGISIVFLLIGMSWVSADTTASKRPTETVPLGIHMVELGDFDPKSSSFQANFWLWAVTPSRMSNWIQTLDYPTGIDVKKITAKEKLVGGKLWASVNVMGKFRTNWDLKDFPINRPSLQIQIEETSLDSSNLFFSADKINSSAKDALLPAGWRISDFSIESGSHRYTTNFGDPSKTTQSSSEYSEVRIRIELERESFAVFWKMTIIPYLAAILVLLSFFFVFRFEMLVIARIPILIGSLFSVSLSMRGGTSELGTADVFTLLDSIHVTTFALILITFLWTISSDKIFRHDSEEKNIKFWNMLMGVALLVIYAAVNAVLVLSALKN